MNNKQAINGLKTFVLTLVISVALFGTAYYVLTNDIQETDNEVNPNFKTQVVEDVEGEVAGDSAFRKLIENPEVLAGTDSTDIPVGMLDETPESTTTPVIGDEVIVPDTGSETLIGVVATTSLVALAGYLYLTGPKLALSKFEEDALEDL